jgi:hypothetical protein
MREINVNKSLSITRRFLALIYPKEFNLTSIVCTLMVQCWANHGFEIPVLRKLTKVQCKDSFSSPFVGRP